MATTAGELRSWLTVAGLTAVVVGQPFFGCQPGDDKGGYTPLDGAIVGVFDDAGPKVVVPALETFRTDAVALAAAVSAWETALAGGDGVAEQEAAQAAWYTAMASWQRLEVMQLGPAGSSLKVVGGEDVRDAVYSWPTTNPCRVDQEVVAEAWTQAGYFDTALVNVQGLAALERLLFAQDAENVCPPQVEINSSGSWDALGDDEVWARRGDYASTLADRLVVHVDGLLADWTEAGGFGAQFADPGTEGSVVTDENVALQALFDALFYLETATKDKKLADPLGARACAPACGVPETPIAGRSEIWIAENIVGFRALFDGGDGTGLDDLLAELGHQDLVDRIHAATELAESEARALGMPIDEAVAQDPPDAATELLNDLAGLTDLVKGDLVTVLSLRLPAEASGDND